MNRIKVVVFMLGLVILGVMVCFFVIWCKNRSDKKKEARRVTRRASEGRKGYDINQEKEEDSESEEELDNKH